MNTKPVSIQDRVHPSMPVLVELRAFVAINLIPIAISNTGKVIRINGFDKAWVVGTN